ncbi:MAG: prepilin-type N-terminal cleavage/methylation domain-containing protein [Bdellovibrionaceae bacterium]|nr:prepilin-type N-terminal cleavage/methylation domain-containing protein [Pseudobdellovibrionaceae bacterium]
MFKKSTAYPLYSLFKNSKVFSAVGFTLMELLIVLLIVGGIAAILVPTMFSKSDREIRAEVRRFSLMAREIQNQALLKNATYRLVFDIEPRTQRTFYWVDTAPQKVLLDDPDERLKFIQNRKDMREDQEEEYQKTNPFKVDTKFTPPNGKDFPGNLVVKKVQLQGIKEDFTEGEIAIHFFPEGLVEFAVIQVQTDDEALKWTLATVPLTGAINIFDGHIDIEELEDQK